MMWLIMIGYGIPKGMGTYLYMVSKCFKVILNLLTYAMLQKWCSDEVWFEGFSIIKFVFNAAINNGGAICLNNENDMYYRQFSDVAFSNNFG